MKTKQKNYRYVDENDFSKKMRSLKTYCPIAYKELIFDVKKELASVHKDGIYERYLKTSDNFKFIYGQIKFIYSVKNGTIIIENLEPQEFLLDGYMFDLEIYKGICCRNKRDKFKIDLFIAMNKKGIMLYE